MSPIFGQSEEEKRLEERGYRRVWPPRMGDLTQRDVQMIHLAEQAEQYLRHHATQRAQRGDSVADRHYDAAGSAREFRERNDFNFDS